MKLLRRIATTLLSIVGLSSAVHAVPESSGPEEMRELRLRTLCGQATSIGISPTEEFPRTYAAVVDFPIDQNTASIVSLSDGNASLYTTGTFGIVGGGAHANVRSAARELVASSDHFYGEGTPTQQFPYPEPGKVRFYLVTFTGVRVLEADLSAIVANESNYSPLFWKAQGVLHQLRLATEASDPK